MSPSILLVCMHNGRQRPFELPQMTVCMEYYGVDSTLLGTFVVVVVVHVQSLWR